MPLVTCAVRDLPRYQKAARWACVRHAMWRQEEWQTRGVLWVPVLSPSRALLSWWRGGPNTPERWPGYVARWRAEKARDEAYRLALRRAADLCSRGTLALACWCSEEGICHRSLLAEELRAAGVPRHP